MPRIVMGLDHQNITITRPVVKSVITQLLHLLEFSTIRNILYIARGRHAETKQEENYNEANKLSTDEYLEIEYEETFVDEYRNVDQYQYDVPPIFAIPELGICVRPLCQRVKIDITAKYISKSYTTIKSWQNSVKRFLLIRSPFYYHDIFYNYNLPTELLAYINQVYDLTERVAPYNRTLNQYINQYFAKNALVVRSNLDDSKHTLAVQYRNIGCLGILSQLPESTDTGKDPPLTSSAFSYTIEFDLPTALIVEYQHYIHNQVIDLRFLRRFQSRVYTGNTHSGLRTFSGSVNTLMDNSNTHTSNIIRSKDGWASETSIENHQPILILPIQLDPLDLRYVLDFNILVEYGFTSELISSLLKYKDKLTHLNKWFLYLELMEVGVDEERMKLIIDNDFLITTKYPMDLRKRHYLIIYVNTDISQVDWESIRSDITNISIILNSVYPHINVNSVLQILGEPPDYSIYTISSINTLINKIRSSNATKILHPTEKLYNFNNSKFIKRFNIRGRI